MMYEKFVTMVEERLNERFALDDVCCYLHEAVKNNDKRRIGVVIRDKRSNISPTIYMEEYYERYVENGEEVEVFEHIIDSICELYESIKISNEREIVDFEWIGDFSKVKEKLVMRLINREKNMNLLRDIPYVPYLDLAITFYVLVQIEEDREATMLVRNEHMEQWGVSVDDIYKIALENSERLLPLEMSSLLSILQEIMPEFETEEEDFMYVVSNNRRSFGASAILYPYRLKSIGMLLKENYYILPSSIHEVIILPESRVTNIEELKCIVTEINATQVPEEEILSNNVYYYNRETDEMTM